MQISLFWNNMKTWKILTQKVGFLTVCHLPMYRRYDGQGKVTVDDCN